MRDNIVQFTPFVLLLVLCFGDVALPRVAADGLEHWEHVEWVDHPSNDGDSFHVRHDGTEFLLRLYYVDVPETGVQSETDARRVRDQTRYFGLSHHRDTVHFGSVAAEVTRAQLARPFTVYTARATAPGRSVSRRIYAFVETSEGKDLAALLVGRGLARAYGVRRALPDGTAAVDAAAGFADLESAAMLERKGIWQVSNGKRLIAARAASRQELAELRQIHEKLRHPAEPIDINSAELWELEMLPGVGPVTARNIQAGRPFAKPQDLLRVARITEHSITNLLPHLKWEPQKDQHRDG